MPYIIKTTREEQLETGLENLLAPEWMETAKIIAVCLVPGYSMDQLFCDFAKQDLQNFTYRLFKAGIESGKTSMYIPLAKYLIEQFS